MPVIINTSSVIQLGNNLPYTLKDARDAVLTQMREDTTNPTFWTISELNRYINDALRILTGHETIIYKTEDIVLATDQYSYNLTESPARILQVLYGNVDITNNKTAPSLLNLALQGKPNCYALNGLTGIIFNPTPTSQENGDIVTIGFRAFHPTLSADNDAITLPDIKTYEDGLLAYVLWRMLSKYTDSEHIKRARDYRVTFEMTLAYLTNLYYNVAYDKLIMSRDR